MYVASPGVGKRFRNVVIGMIMLFMMLVVGSIGGSIYLVSERAAANLPLYPEFTEGNGWRRHLYTAGVFVYQHSQAVLVIILVIILALVALLIIQPVKRPKSVVRGHGEEEETDESPY